MAGKRRRGGIASVDALLRKVYPAPDQLPAVRVFRWWYRAVPDRVAERARPVRLRRGELVVHVASSTWAQELSFLHESLLRRCQRAAPEAGVRRILFKVGKLPPRPPRPKEPGPKEPAPVEPSELVKLPEDLARALAGIEDDRVREAVARAATTALSKR
ncbi:MAG: DciA family protein [Myxococcota bacterium]